MASRTLKKVPTSHTADQCQTPQYALDPVAPFLKPSWIIWESACGDGNLVLGLRGRGYQVIGTDILYGIDFFSYRPDYFDAILTNPPFSVKLEWLARCYEFGRPFALLLPVEVLGVYSAQRMFERFGVEIILLSRRIDFQTVNTSFAKSSSWFPSCWITHGLNIGQQITFGKITKRPDEQMPLMMEAV